MPRWSRLSGGLGPAEEIALAVVARRRGQEVELHFGLDPLGDDLEPEGVCQLDHGMHDCFAPWVTADPGYE